MPNALRYLLILLLPVFLTQPGVAEQEEPIVVYPAKRIYTMNRMLPEATAVAVRGDRILSVGSMESLQPWLSRSAHRVDRTFENHYLMPGFVDPHQHPLIGGMALSLPSVSYYNLPNPYGPPSRGAKDKAAVIARLQ